MKRTDAVRAALAAVFCSAALAGTPVLADCDTTAATLTGFTFSPPSINTTSASQTVTCNMTLTDALSGVASASCSFTSPDQLHRQSCTAVAPTSGTTNNGTWSCVITFPRYAPSGTWTASVSAPDAVGNTGFGPINPGDLGFSSTLTVTSDPDVTAPALPTFTALPGSVNVSAASQTVTCTMTLTDAKSGVAFASCQLTAPNTSAQTAGCFAGAPTSGTRNSGVFTCAVTIPRYADAGTWTSSVFAVDQVGNIGTFTPAATVAVTSVPEDIVEPSLVPGTTDFNPKTISVGASSKPVVCTMGVADSPAGVDTATCSFNIFGVLPVPPFDFYNQTQSCTAGVPATGTRNSGTFQCTITFPRYAAGGSWSGSVSLRDLVGNVSDDPLALPLTVDCGAGEVETTCRFAANKTTLSWDAVASATQYNVYRGPFTNFVDGNADHLPDGGYGTCQNSLDPNITDTSFVDASVPSVAQKGFFYLVSYKQGGVEKGLGFNSFAQPRTVAAPCP